MSTRGSIDAVQQSTLGGAIRSTRSRHGRWRLLAGVQRLRKQRAYEILIRSIGSKS